MNVKDKNADVSTQDIYAMLAGELLPSDIHRRREIRVLEKAGGRMQTEAETEFQSDSTPYLIECMRREQHEWSYGGWYYNREPRGADFYYYAARGDKYPTNVDEAFFAFRARQFAFKKILASRPHLVSKPEAEAKRREAASVHHGPKKRGGKSYNQPIKVGARRAEQAKRKRQREMDALCKKHAWASPPWQVR